MALASGKFISGSYPLSVNPQESCISLVNPFPDYHPRHANQFSLEIQFSLPFSIKNNNFDITIMLMRVLASVTTNLGSHGVFNAHHADTGQSTEDFVFIVPVRLTLRGREISVSKADGPQAL